MPSAKSGVGLVEEALGRGKGGGRPARQTRREHGGAAIELGGGHHGVDQAELEGGRGVEAIAEQRDLHRLLAADMAGQEIGRAAIGAGTEMTIRQGEDGILGGDGEVTGQHQTHADPGDGAVYPGDDRHGQPPHGDNGGMDAMDEALEIDPLLGRRQVHDVLEAADVAARHEAGAGASQHDDADLRSAPDPLDGGGEPVHHRRIESVQHLWTVQRDRRDRALDPQQHRVFHGGLLSHAHCVPECRRRHPLPQGEEGSGALVAFAISAIQ